MFSCHLTLTAVNVLFLSKQYELNLLPDEQVLERGAEGMTSPFLNGLAAGGECSMYIPSNLLYGE